MSNDIIIAWVVGCVLYLFFLVLTTAGIKDALPSTTTYRNAKSLLAGTFWPVTWVLALIAWVVEK